MRQAILLGIILLSSKMAHGYSYADVIRHNQDRANYNKAYAKAELKMYKQRYRDYARLSSKLNRYATAHMDSMKADSRLRAHERELPATVRYEPDWNYGATGIKWRTD